MSMKKIILIILGITLVSFGICFLSLNFSEGKRGHDFKGENIDVAPGIINVDADGVKVNVGLSGVHVTDDEGDNVVNVSPSGVNLKSGDEKLDLKSNSIDHEKLEDIKGIEKIDIGTSFVDINLIPEDRDNVRIHFNGKIKSGSGNIPSMTSEKSGSTLYIDVKNKGTDSYYNNYSNYSDLKLDIYIPKEYSGKFEMNTSSGDITGEKMNVKSINIATSSGNINLKNINSDTVTLETSSGDGNIKSVNAGNIKFKSSSGDMTIEDMKGILNAATSSGEISVGYKELNGDIAVVSSSGDVKVYLPNNSKFNLNAVGASGEIECNFPLSVVSKGEHRLVGKMGEGNNNIDITTSSGDISIYSKGK